MKNFLEFIKKYKFIIITIVVIIIIGICITTFLSTRNSEKELDFSDFEKTAIYNYLENDVLDVKSLYLKANNDNLNEVELLQIQIQGALDTYFLDNPDYTSISVSDIYAILNSEYSIDTSLIDFHGIVLSNYEYNSETDEIVVNTNNNVKPDIELIDKFSNFDSHSLDITKITQISDNQYKVYGNILNNDIVVSTTEVTLKLDNNQFAIENCTITD